MVIYTREEKVLIIPEGEGCGCQGGGGHPSKNCEREKREAYESGYTAGLHADCGEAIDEAYNSGYTAGLEACSGSSCTFEEGRLDISDFWDGGPTVVYPSTADGFSQFTVEDTNGSYAHKHYMDGYNDGLADCSGSTDCSSAITEAYQSGYTEGYNQGQADCPECSGSTCNIQPLKAVVPQFDNYPVDYQMDIYPDAGYDGLGKVSIDKRPLYEQGYQAGLADCSGSTDCSSAITEAYQSGYTEGYEDALYEKCNLTDTLVVVPSGSSGVVNNVVPPTDYVGFGSVSVNATEYGQEMYQSGYTAGLADCSGSTPCDCSSAVTEAYQSGYTEGYNEGYDDALYEKCDLETTLIVVPSGSTGIMNDITPTEGAGFASVSVNATEYGEWKYQSGYTEGYQSGYTQGQADCDCTETYQIGYNDGYEDGRESVTSGCPMQEKSISLSSIEESVSPDYGYAGLSEVHINAQSFYNTAYNDGYAAGLEDCSGSTDCSSAITEAYQSGYTEGHASGYTEGYNQGQADCPECSGGTCNLEASQVTLGYDWTGFTRVYPSQGYDGLSDVIVADIGYGQRKYDEGYADGHTSGYTEGYNAAITANCGSAITEAYESGVTEGQGSIFSVKVRWLSPVTSWNLDNNYYPDLFIVDESGTSHQLNYVYQQSPTLVRYNTGMEDDTPQGWIMFAEFAGYLQDGAKYIQPYQVKFPMLNNNLWNNNIEGLSVEINGEVIHNWRQDNSGLDDWQFGSGAWKFTPLATVVSDTYYDATHKMVTFYIQGQVPNNN